MGEESQIIDLADSDSAGNELSFYAAVRSGTCWILSIASLLCCIGSIGTEFGPAQGWLLFVLWVWIAIVVHELGHALAALACGWRIFVFAAGPFGFHVHNREFAIIPRPKRTEFAGFVVPSPSSAEVWTRGRRAIIDVAGPIMSLALAGISALAAFIWRPTSSGDFEFSMALVALCLMSVSVAWITLTPSASGKHISDIQNFISAVRTDEGKWRQTRAIGQLYGLVKYKVRLRDLPLWMLGEAQVASRDDPQLRRAYDALVISIVLDTLPVDAKQARNLIDGFRKTYGEDAWLASCDAYLSAVWEGDGDGARNRLWKGQILGELRPLGLAAEAAVLAKEGGASAAEAKLKEMHDEVAKTSAFSDPTFRDIKKQIHATLLQALQKKLTAG
jgi:hypothetical protein